MEAKKKSILSVFGLLSFLLLLFCFKAKIGCACLSLALSVSSGSLKASVTRMIYEGDCDSALLQALGDEESTDFCQERLVRDGPRKLSFLFDSYPKATLSTEVRIYELIGNIEREHPRSLGAYLRSKQHSHRQLAVLILTDPHLMWDMPKSERDYYTEAFISSFMEFETDAELKASLLHGLSQWKSKASTDFLLASIKNEELSVIEFDSLRQSLRLRYLQIKESSNKQLFLKALREHSQLLPKQRFKALTSTIPAMKAK